MRPDSQTALKSLYNNWSLLFTAARWAEPKLRMKLLRTEKNSTMYVQTALKNRKLPMSLLETGAGAGSHYMKEEHIVDESELSASSTMRKEKSTIMSKHVKKMAPLSSICYVDSRNFGEDHELGIG